MVLDARKQAIQSYVGASFPTPYSSQVMLQLRRSQDNYAIGLLRDGIVPYSPLTLTALDLDRLVNKNALDLFRQPIQVTVTPEGNTFELRHTVADQSIRGDFLYSDFLDLLEFVNAPSESSLS